MALEYRFDPAHRLIWVRAAGVLAPADLFDYQRAVKAHAHLSDLAELVDVREVAEVVEPTPDHLRLLAVAAVAIDPPGCTAKLAIVVGSDATHNLAHQYELYRALQPHSSREIRVFRSFGDACAFLGAHDLRWEACAPFA